MHGLNIISADFKAAIHDEHSGRFNQSINIRLFDGIISQLTQTQLQFTLQA